MNKARVESFSDGVFAFAITLLVLGVPVPDLAVADDAHLRIALMKAVHQLVPYLTSFATIGIIWLNHHALFHAAQRVDHPVLVLNLLLLLVVSFIPFPTAVLGRYGALPASAFLYGCVLTALGATFTLLSFCIEKRGLRAKENLRRSRWELMRNLTGTVTYPAATILSLWRPQASVLIYFLLAAFYLLPAPERRSGLTHSPGAGER